MTEPIPKMVYLDNHATTRVDSRVVEAMLPFFSESYGNAGSRGYALGDQGRAAVEEARQSLARNLGTDPKSLIFTSGATESNNLAIFGVADSARRRGKHWISVLTEHQSVLAPLRRLAKQGEHVTLLEVEQHPSLRTGWLDPQRVAAAIRPETCLVSVMLANNEIGVIQPLAALAILCHERGVALHCDATQAVGKIPLDVQELGVDLLSFSAHKFYGPKGVGGLVVRKQRPALRLAAQLLGGGQQGELRSGTLNVPGIVGMAHALQLCVTEMPQESVRLATLRNRLWQGLQEVAPEVVLYGPALESFEVESGIPDCECPLPATTEWKIRLPGNLNVAIPGMDGEALQMAMPGVAISSGATCTAASTEPSHVLLALGLSAEQARSSLRFGLGRFNSDEDILFALERISAAIQKLRRFVR